MFTRTDRSLVSISTLLRRSSPSPPWRRAQQGGSDFRFGAAIDGTTFERAIEIAGGLAENVREWAGDSLDC